MTNGPLVDNIEFDLHRTLTQGYTEIEGSYGLLHQWKQRRHESPEALARYNALKGPKRKEMWNHLKHKGTMGIAEKFLETVLVGESEEVFDEAVKDICSGESHLPLHMKALAAVHPKFRRLVSLEIDNDAKELLQVADGRGIETGVYTRSFEEIAKPFLIATGLMQHIDYVKGNRLIIKDGYIVGMDEEHAITEGKPEFWKYLRDEIRADPDRTALIDDGNFPALSAVMFGIVAPNAKSGFKEYCLSHGGIWVPKGYDESKRPEGRAIYVVDDLGEVYKILNI